MPSMAHQFFSISNLIEQGLDVTKKDTKNFVLVLFGPQPNDRQGSEVLGQIFTFLDMQNGW